MMGDSEADLLLSDRIIKVSTPDLREASRAIERLQGPFKVKQKSTVSGDVSPIRVRAASCGKVALSTFSFGSTVDIEPKGLEGAVLVTTAVRGRAGLTVGGQVFATAAGGTFISQEEDRPLFLYDPDTEVLKLRFERRRMEEACMKMYDCLPSTPLHFDSVMVLPQATQRWRALLRFLVASVNAADELMPNPLETASTEELQMLTVLTIQSHNHHASRGAENQYSVRKGSNGAAFCVKAIAPL
jgi:hypothetical protein